MTDLLVDQSHPSEIMVNSMMNELVNVTINEPVGGSTLSNISSDYKIINGITNAQAKLADQVIIPLNIVSIIGAFVVIFCIVYLRWRHRRLADRVSLRLTLGIAIGDALFSVFQVIGALHRNGDNWWCAICGWGYVETTLFSVFLTMCIAFNLHAVFVHNAHPGPSWESWYFVAAIVGSVGASLAPWILGIFGYDSTERTCWFRGVGTKNVLIWQWVSLFGWLALAVVYCVIAVIAVAWKLVREQALAREDEDEEQRLNEQCQHRSLLRRQLSNIAIDSAHLDLTLDLHCNPNKLEKTAARTSGRSPVSTVADMLGDTWRRVVVEVSEDSNGTNITIPVDRGMVGTRRDTGRNSGHCKERCSKRSFSNNTSQQDEEIVVVQVASSALRVPSRFHYRHRSLASDNMTSSLSHNECIGMEYEHQLKQKSLKMHQMIRRAAGRIVLYPLVPILTQTLTIASEIDTYINGRVRFGLYLASYAAASCPGLLNALAFIVFDPAVHNILRVVREDLLTQYRARRDSGHLGWSGQVALWALHGGQAGEVAEERARRRSARLSTDFMPFGLYRDELEAAAERSRQVTGTAITSRTSTASAPSSNPDVVVRTRRASAISGETAQVYRSLAHRRYRSYSGSSATNDSSSFSLQQAHRQKIEFGVPVAIVNGSGHRKQTSSVSAQSRDQLIKGPVMRKSSGSSLGNTSAQSKPEQIISEPSATPEEASNNETDTSWITTTYGSSSGQLPTSRFSWQPPSLNDTNSQCAEADAEVEASELNDKVPAMVSFSSIYTRSRRGSRISLPMTSSAWREVELAYSDIFAPLSASSVPVHEILRLAHLHVRRSASDGNISANIPSRNSSFQMDGIAPIYNVSQQTATTASSFNSSMLHDQSLSNAYAQMATAAAAATVSTPQPAHCQSTDSVIININNEPAVLPGHHLFSDISTVDESQSSQSQYSTKDIDWPTSSLDIAPPNYNSICVPIDTTTNNKSGSTLEFLYLDEEHYLALNDDVQPVLSEETCEMLRLM